MSQPARSGSAAPAPADLQGKSALYLNRELSWLAFNSRVLALAEDPEQPLLERVKFLAISSSNLDEFFQVRVAGLQAQVEAEVGVTSPDGLTPREQLAAIRNEVLRATDRQYEIFAKQLVPALAEAGIQICRWNDLDEQDVAHLARVYEQQIFPVLTPLSVDPAHPFPYISNLSLNLAAVVRDALTGEHRFARVKVPALFTRFLKLPDGERFIPIEQVIGVHLPSLFPGTPISPSRKTRRTTCSARSSRGSGVASARVPECASKWTRA
jgi:polyphosphate kinase